MIDSVVLAGRYEGFKDDHNLILRIDSSTNKQVVQIIIGKAIKKQLLNFIHENVLI